MATDTHSAAYTGWPVVGRWDYIGVPLVVLAFVVYLLVAR